MTADCNHRFTVLMPSMLHLLSFLFADYVLPCACLASPCRQLLMRWATMSLGKRETSLRKRCDCGHKLQARNRKEEEVFCELTV